MTRIALAILCATFFASAGVVEAHHAHTDFELQREVTVAGTIESIQFRNPHVLLVVRTTGSTLYTDSLLVIDGRTGRTKSCAPTTRPR